MAQRLPSAAAPPARCRRSGAGRRGQRARPPARAWRTWGGCALPRRESPPSRPLPLLARSRPYVADSRPRVGSLTAVAPSRSLSFPLPNPLGRPDTRPTNDPARCQLQARLMARLLALAETDARVKRAIADVNQQIDEHIGER